MITRMATGPRTERLTAETAAKLRNCDEVERWQESGWHCATGRKAGRVHVMVHADSGEEIDIALGLAQPYNPHRTMAQPRSTIADMAAGETRWAVPWSFHEDGDGGRWLCGAALAHDSPGGTAQMCIWRDGAGWHVDASRVAPDYTWRAGEEPMPTRQPIRVTTFVR